MTDESTFRLLLAFVAGALVLLWLRGFVRGGLSKDAFWTRAEGPFTALALRLLLAACLAGIGLYVMRPELLAWSTLPIPTWLRWLGLPMGLSSLTLMLWAQNSIGRNFFASLSLSADHVLITQGPYRWVRHPMYLCFMGIFMACGLLAANWFIGVTGMLAELVIMIWRTPREEKMMAERFGGEYESYRLRTGAYLPRRRN